MIFSTLFNTLIPLCGLVGTGYFAGKYFEIHTRSLSVLLIYFLNPAVYFTTILQMDLGVELFFLPLVMAVICNMTAFSGYGLGKLFYKNNKANLVGMISVAGNTGLFGLPLVLAVLGSQAAGICMLANIGLMFAINSTGYYIGARGHHTVRDSLQKVLKIPAIYAALAAILYNLSGLPYPGAVETYGHYFIGTWVVLGMMIIGIALANEKSLVFNKGFFALLMGIKLILWPFFVWGFVMLDQTLLFLFDRDIYVMLLIFSITPLPSTAVSFAASLDLHTGETSMAVLLSTLLSIIYIPLAFFIFGFM